MLPYFVRLISLNTVMTIWENSSAQIETPLNVCLQRIKKTRNTFNQNYNVGLNWKPFKNWTFRSEFGYGWKFDDTEQYWGVDAVSNSKYGYNGSLPTC